MKITFVISQSIYDCQIEITDFSGSRYYIISALSNSETQQYIDLDICGDNFDLTLTPLTPNITPLLNELEENTWKDKFAKKATNVLFSSIEKTILRIGCKYHIGGLKNGDRLDINLQSYAFGTFDRFNLLELIPMVYMFFDVSNFNTRFTLLNAFGANRKDILKTAKALTLTDVMGYGFFVALFTYPIQVGRIKWLSKNKRIFKFLSRFNNLSDIERQKIIDKQEKFFNS